MRIRTIKPEFWTDSLMVSLPRDVRLFFIGLWNAADDEGWLADDPEQLRMLIFPSDLDFDVDGALDLLLACDRIERFVDEDGSSALHIKHWLGHQRVDHPAKSRIARDNSRKLAIRFQDRRAIAEKYGCAPGETKKAECYYCGQSGKIIWYKLRSGRPSAWVYFSGLEMDHFIAENDGGASTSENLVLACRTCNRNKATTNGIDFINNTREISRGLALEGKGKEQGKEQGTGNRGGARARFVPPTVDEVSGYIQSQGYSFDAAAFHAYYESNGWKVGRSAMKDWKAACRTWQSRQTSRPVYSSQPRRASQAVTTDGPGSTLEGVLRIVEG